QRKEKHHERLQHVGAATLQRLSSTSRAVARNCLTLDPPARAQTALGAASQGQRFGELNVQREAATALAEAARSPANCLQTHSIPPRSYGIKSGCSQRARRSPGGCRTSSTASSACPPGSRRSADCGQG